MGALQDLWSAVSGRAVAPPARAREARWNGNEDDASEPGSDGDLPEYEAQPITGYVCVIVYRDAKGRESERAITCQRLDRIAGDLHIRGYCHHRAAVRNFRVDRIVVVIDAHTGEVIDDGATHFAQFRVDREQLSGATWGLSLKQKADLIAGLNAMVFVGRCDREWHPLERETLEPFITSYWLRSEIMADLPIDDILAHAERLSPDAESFFVSLQRCRDNPVLAGTIRRHLQVMVEADGRICGEELHWGAAVDRFFAAA